MNDNLLCLESPFFTPDTDWVLGVTAKEVPSVLERSGALLLSVS